MKILYLESAQNLGGARKATIKIAEVVSRNHNVQIADIFGSCKPFIEACEQSAVSFDIILPCCDPHYVRSANSSWERFISLLTFIPHTIKVGRKIRKYIERNHFDYVCVSGFRPLTYMFFARPRTRIIFFAHGWYLNRMLSKREKYLLKHFVYRIACISQATKQALYNNGVAKLEQLYVVHNCIEIKDIQVPPASVNRPNDGLVLLHCAGFTAGKGQHISIQVARRLKEEGVPFKMIFTGIIYQGVNSRRYYEQLLQMTKDYSLEQYVEFVVGHSNVYDYMQACDILIHPSETEGFPLVVMEAQIMRKVVIANAVGGVIDMILDGYTGFLPAHNSVDEYVSIIKRLTKDNSLRQAIAYNAQKLAQTCFTPEQQSMELNRIFKD